jgi:hypothetical protein
VTRSSTLQDENNGLLFGLNLLSCGDDLNAAVWLMLFAYSRKSLQAAQVRSKVVNKEERTEEIKQNGERWHRSIRINERGKETEKDKGN